MAQVTLASWPILWPSVAADGNAIQFQSNTIDADGEMVAWVLRAPKDMTINRVGFRFATVTQAPTNGLTVSLQDVDGSGNPDGTGDQSRLVEAGSISTNTWVTTGLITSDGTDTGTKRTVTKGEIFSVVVEFASFALSDSLAISTNTAGMYSLSATRGTQYSLHFTTSWGSRRNGGLNIAIQDSDSTWIPIIGCVPWESVAATNVISTGDPDEVGIKFTSPAKMTVGGIAVGKASATNGTYTVHLYDANDVELASGTADGDHVVSVSTQPVELIPFDDNDTVELSAGSVYRATVEVTSATNMGVVIGTPDSSDFQSATPWGTHGTSTERADAGTWTDATDGSMWAISLIVEGIDDGVSSGGGGLFSSRHRR